MSGRRVLLGSLACVVLCTAGCRTTPSAFPSAQLVAPGQASDDIFNLRLSKATLRARGASDALLDRIGASAFRYYRALAEPVKHRTCEAFIDLRWRLPSGAVHGDAHLEQFVVTDDPLDDVILEARRHSLPEFRGCVWRPTGGSLNVFMLTSLLAHPLPDVFGVLPNPEGDDVRADGTARQRPRSYPGP